MAEDRENAQFFSERRSQDVKLVKSLMFELHIMLCVIMRVKTQSQDKFLSDIEINHKVQVPTGSTASGRRSSASSHLRHLQNLKEPLFWLISYTIQLMSES